MKEKGGGVMGVGGDGRQCPMIKVGGECALVMLPKAIRLELGHGRKRK